MQFAVFNSRTEELLDVIEGESLLDAVKNASGFPDGPLVIERLEIYKKRHQTCCSCGGTFHQATGHYWTPKTWVCGTCIRTFYTWMRGHTHRHWGKPHACPYEDK